MQERCHQPPWQCRSWRWVKPGTGGRGRGDSISLQGNGVRGLSCPRVKGVSVTRRGAPGASHVAGAAAPLYLLRAAEAPAGTEQPWLQLLPAGKPPARRRRRRPVAGGLRLSPPLPAPRRAPPAQRCGEESGDPARLEKNRSGTGPPVAAR